MLESLINNFLHYVRFEKRMSDKTYIAYKNDLTGFEQFLKEWYGDIALADIGLNHLRSWIATLASDAKMKPTSLQRKSSALKSFFKYLLRKGLIQNNPAQLLRSPKAPKLLPQFLEQEQTAALLEKIPKGNAADLGTFTDFLIIEILYQTGMRRAELAGLKESDVEFPRRQLRVLGKRNKERLIPVSDALLEDIRTYVELKRKIFENPAENLLILKSGKALYDKYIYNTVKANLKDITTLNKKSPHVMRHTFATQLSNNGADLNAIKELLGHSSLASTQVYTHTNIEQLKAIYRKAHPKS